MDTSSFKELDLCQFVYLVLVFFPVGKKHKEDQANLEEISISSEKRSLSPDNSTPT